VAALRLLRIVGDLRSDGLPGHLTAATDATPTSPTTSNQAKREQIIDGMTALTATVSMEATSPETQGPSSRGLSLLAAELGSVSMRWFVGAAAVVLLAGCGASSKHVITDRTVEVHGQTLAVHCRGTGSPTVVFEAGLGFGAVEWVEVQPQVARQSRTCAYDRLGEGESAATQAGVAQTVDDQAQTLRAVLAGAGVEPPYILVGHSWGGAIVQRFAFKHRDEVAGIVLVDSSEADVTGRLLAMLPRCHADRCGSIANVRAGLVDTLKPSLNQEAVDWRASIPQLHQLKSLGSIPLIVLTAGTSDIGVGLPSPYGERTYEIWLRAQSQLAALSSQSVHAVAEHSGHLVPVYQPEAVVAAVNAVVRAARNRGRLQRCHAVFRGVTGVRCI
jgi:pimeloyl-ACP methyl ester carboxylesterase